MSTSLKRVEAERNEILKDIEELERYNKKVPNGLSQWPPVHNLRKFRRGAATRRVKRMKNAKQYLNLESVSKKGNTGLFHPIYNILKKFQHLLVNFEGRLEALEKKS